MRNRLYKVLLGLNSSTLRTAADHRYYPPIMNTKENQDVDSIIKEIEKIERFWHQIVICLNIEMIYIRRDDVYHNRSLNTYNNSNSVFIHGGHEVFHLRLRMVCKT